MYFQCCKTVKKFFRNEKMCKNIMNKNSVYQPLFEKIHFHDCVSEEILTNTFDLVTGLHSNKLQIYIAF